MNGKKTDCAVEIDALERDLASVLPFVQKGFAGVEPSAETLAAIHQAAERQAMRKPAFWRRVRVIAIAASIILVVGGLCHVYLPELTHPQPKAVTVAQQESNDRTDMDPDVLLYMQGMDDESFFLSDDMEVAWF
ncbi:MAG: hypothetical protein J6U40_11040 [Kiritimatiellae bacterium]|nr:hypothetical protein [Kiritimatiellia bacterium]MBP5227289.1 hypothetical protein [Kiritimatiellia bacterium]